MKIKSAVLPILIGICSYGIFLALSRVFGPDFSIRNISILNHSVLQPAMFIAVAAGLYLNVSEINTSELLKNRAAILAVLLVGVPVKILVPGFILFGVSSFGLGVALLCATVIAQIDPILTARNVDPERFSEKSGTILRCWSSFDDPITVLFAFYVFLPLFFEASSGSIGSYLFGLCIETLVCGSTARFLYDANIRSQKLGVVATCLSSALLGRFLLPAALGLAVRPFRNERTKTTLLNWIFWFSAAVIGGLAVGLDINWTAGLVLGVSTFAIAQPLVSLMFIRGDSPPNFWRIVFGHQNGMTAILLTIAIELQTGQTQLMSITIPAVLFIALFYGFSNWWLDRYWPTPNTSEVGFSQRNIQSLMDQPEVKSLSNSSSYSAVDNTKELNKIVNEIEDLTKLTDDAQEALANSHHYTVTQLRQKYRPEPLLKNELEHELKQQQQCINSSLNHLDNLKAYLLDIQRQIIKQQKTLSTDVPKPLRVDFDGAHRLLMAVIKPGHRQSMNAKSPTTDAKLEKQSLTFSKGHESSKPIEAYTADITARLNNIEERLQKFCNVSNK
ncbi:MAG: hypothetical protein AAF821_08505 [Cyanobacteria bacterium P01_D01_bin.156]